VLEPWITPSFFENTGNEDIIDEYTYGALQSDRESALDVLENHWNTWITEEDFEAIAAAGLNHVRIPIGFWHVPLTASDTRYNTSVYPYIPGAWPHFIRALNLAKKHNLRVIVDLHGARGSQNGYDNSGQRTSNPVWGDTPEYVAHTLDVIRFIASKVGGMVDVIQLLNEAAGWKGGQWPDVIRKYWRDGYNIIREVAGSRTKVMIGDAFLTVNSWEGFLTYPDAEGTMMDYHEYQIFSLTELARSREEHISYVCEHHLPTLTGYASRNIWTVIGEWSLAVRTNILDVARFSNGWYAYRSQIALNGLMDGELGLDGTRPTILIVQGLVRAQI
jgi:glucan 1,3-beta-glucosidase